MVSIGTSFSSEEVLSNRIGSFKPIMVSVKMSFLTEEIQCKVCESEDELC